MNFLDLKAEQSDPATARAAVLPVPYEMTTSYGRGTAEGPAAIIAASTEIELYDDDYGADLFSESGVATLDGFRPGGKTPDECVDGIAEAVARELRPGRFLCVLGGEHALSAGVARAVAADPGRAGAEGPLCAVVIDAHADCRDSYEGSRQSHACASRRISELMPVMVFGVRSLSEECAAFLAGEGAGRVAVHYADDMGDGLRTDAIAEFCGGRSVFLSIDVDGLDPSIMPATGTPEPGGLSYRQVLGIIDAVAASGQLVAADVVELAPIPGMHSPDFVAARLAARTILAAVWGPAPERPARPGAAARP